MMRSRKNARFANGRRTLGPPRTAGHFLSRISGTRWTRPRSARTPLRHRFRPRTSGSQRYAGRDRENAIVYRRLRRPVRRSRPPRDRVADAGALGMNVHKMPQPRSVPVALLEWRGREVNLLTGSSGLPPPDVAARAAREFQLGPGTDLAGLIADPFDLLRNKLSLN